MKKFWCLFFMFWPIVAVVSCVIAPGRNWWFPYNRPSATPLGGSIDDLFHMILVIVTVTFVGTMIALGYVLWRGAQETTEKGWYTHGSHNLEVIWSIVPAGVLLFISLYQLDVWAQYRIKSNFPKEAVKAPVAEVTARQFEWRIRYPAPGKTLQPQPQPDDLYSVNDLRVPTGRPVMIQLKTQDVQHSFFVPVMRVKQDAVPGQTIPVWFETIKPDQYELVCAELCGWGHYKMKARVWAQPQAEYEAYLRELQKEQFDDGVTEPATAGDQP